MAGGGIFLDLSECKSRDAQRLFLCALFNYLRDSLPQTNKLKIIIAIDEAHRLFQEQVGYHVHDDDFISNKGFQGLMAEFIEESRSQGISFIFIDQDPKLLMSKVRSAPMVHFIFSLDEDNAKLLAHNKEQEELINNLGNREVFCRNKITKERFLFRTNDMAPNE
jgi:DNA helicase HerA-like ATPase